MLADRVSMKDGKPLTVCGTPHPSLLEERKDADLLPFVAKEGRYEVVPPGKQRGSS